MNKKWILGCLSAGAVGLLIVLSSCCKTCRTCHANEIMCSCNKAKKADAAFTKDNGMSVKPLKPLSRKVRQ